MEKTRTIWNLAGLALLPALCSSDIW